MKGLCLALCLCLCLTACGGVELGETPSTSPESPGVSAPVSPEPSELVEVETEKLTAPPALAVSTLYHADSVTASSGNYQWSREMPDGTTQSVIACGASPLDTGMEWPLLYTAFGPGDLPPLKEGEFLSSIVPVYYLDFGAAPPETVTARRWSVKAVGQGTGFDDAEEVSVEWVEGAEGRVPYGMEAWVDMAGCYALYPLGDGEFVYEIHAEWDGLGNADYIFQTLPQVRGEEISN